MHSFELTEISTWVPIVLELMSDLAIKGTVLISLALICLAILRRASAAYQHLVLALSFYGLLLLPLQLLVQPSWRVGLLPAVSRWDEWFFVPGLLAFLWLVGMTLVLIRLGNGLKQLRRLRRHAIRVEDPGWCRMARKLSAEMGLSDVQLLESAQFEVAISVGLIRPTVLLPRGAKHWSLPQRYAILRHELAHVKRGDNWTNLVVQLVCALYWFNPLIWWARRRVRLYREQACDNSVLEAGTRASEYAGYLLNAGLRSSGCRLSSTVEISHASALKRRLLAILDPRIIRDSNGWVRCASHTGAALLLLLMLSLLDVWFPLPVGAGLEYPFAPTPTDQTRLFGEAHAIRPPSLFRSFDSFLANSNGAVQLNTPSGSPYHRPAAVTIDSNGVPQSILPRWPAQASAVMASASEQIVEWGKEDRLLIGHSLPHQQRLKQGAESNPPQETSDPEAEILQLDLGTLGGSSAQASDLNELGFIVGKSSTAGGKFHPFFWTLESGMLDLGLPPGLVEAEAVKVNNRGDILIVGQDREGSIQSFLWSTDQGLQFIESLGGNFTRGLALNEAGQVVGSSEISPERRRAFFWSQETGTVNLGGQEAVAINDYGLVVGRADSFSFVWHPESGYERLGEVGIKAIPFALNESGEVVGMAFFESDQPARAFRWTASEGLLDLGTLDFDSAMSVAYQINDLGHIVGVSRREVSLGEVTPEAESTVQFQDHSFLWTPQEGMREIETSVLPGVILNNTGQLVGNPEIAIGTQDTSAVFWSARLGSIPLHETREQELVAQAVAINDRGQIAGNLQNRQQQTSRALLWQVRDY